VWQFLRQGLHEQAPYEETMARLAALAQAAQ
jgi:hypothetical protein